MLDAIATGKTVAITSPGVAFQVATNEQPNVAATNSATPSTVNASIIQLNGRSFESLHKFLLMNWFSAFIDEPPSKKSKVDTEVINHSNQIQWEGESDDHKQQIVELLQANLHQLDEVRLSIETQGNAIFYLLMDTLFQTK